MTRLLPAACLLLFAWPASAADRPNVLFIVADDLNTDLGCYGHAVAKTPNLDRLAKSGVRFERAYVQYPVCNPSRTSFLTGLRPETTKVMSNADFFRTKLPDVVTMPQCFRANGYRTVSLGKVFHRGLNPDDPKAEMDDVASWDRTFYGKATTLGNMGEGRNLTGGKLEWCRWKAAAGDDADQPDGQTTAEAAKLLGEQQDKPLFLAIGFYRPHDPFQSPKKYFDLYPLDKLVPPTSPVGYALPNRFALPGGYTQSFDAFTDADKREFLRAYYAGVSFMDAQVGKLLDALEASGNAVNTIVVFLGDHGYELGVRNWWNKNTLFEKCCRVPLIVRDPQAKGNGGSARGIVECLDLFPTLAERCGLKNVPANLEGTSFVNPLNDPAAAGKAVAFTASLRGKTLGRSVRTDRWRYTQWTDETSELYDHSVDAGEWKNLAGDPAQATTIAELKRLLGK